MKKPYRIISFLLITFTISGFPGGCRQQKGEDDEGERSAVKAVVSVKVGVVRERDALVTINAMGKTDALRKEKLYSPIAGRIVSLRVFEGTEVKKGDLLVTIQTKESEAATIGAETMLQAAVTDEQKAEAERTLKLAKLTQSCVNVLAKFEGVVSTRSVSEGELVPENAELLSIIDLSTIDFIADVSLRDVSSVRRGQNAFIRFQSLPDKIFSATVDAINPQTDIQSQTVKVRIQFLKLKYLIQSLLRTDMVGMAQITTGVHRRALFVPRSALIRHDEDNSYSVVTFTSDSLAKSVPVSVGLVNDSTAEVRSDDLRSGNAVVIEGNYALPDSTRIRIER